MDTSIAPDPEESDTMDGNVELPCDLDTLKVAGTAPEVGDKVDVRVSGNVTRIVNNMAYIRPTEINDIKMPGPGLEPNPHVSESDRLERMSASAGSI